MQKKLIPHIFIKQGKAVNDFKNDHLFENGDVCEIAKHYSDIGADGLLIFDLSEGDDEHEISIGLIKEVARLTNLPIMAGGNIKRAEDVKKLLYAGCKTVFLNLAKQHNIDLIEEVSKRFGKEKIAACADNFALLSSQREMLEQYTDLVVLLQDDQHLYEAVNALPIKTLPVLSMRDQTRLVPLLSVEQVCGISGHMISNYHIDLGDLKGTLKAAGIKVQSLDTNFSWSEFTLNNDGLLPVVVQDYVTLEVLMVAYMNQEAFENTLTSGKMTYYSRSRQELWLKGATSGHYQYVKELSNDCDNDTLLAKVAQVGSACHTGHKTCFYQTMVTSGEPSMNPRKVFESVYATILDRKEHPKEGSYTNYLFDKGIDKILKKVGEEATEIIIAAKNPNPEEIKYEAADFLYHLMVLMAEKGVTWEDITKELAQR